MKWFNEPAAWNVQADELTVTAAAQTDFWRETHYGFIRDNGHFYYREMTGDFVAQVKITGRYEALYDQAGLMVRVDEANWMKCGIEFVAGVQQASVVVTRDFSDWSVLPLPANPPAIWLRVSRRRETLEVHYSLNGSDFTMLRLAYLKPDALTEVGPMCASPDGAGFSVTFEGLKIQNL